MPESPDALTTSRIQSTIIRADWFLFLATENSIVLADANGRLVTQTASGLEERAYTVRSNTGVEQVVRSPREEFAIGQQASVKGRRLRAVTP